MSDTFVRLYGHQHQHHQQPPPPPPPTLPSPSPPHAGYHTLGHAYVCVCAVCLWTRNTQLTHTADGDPAVARTSATAPTLWVLVPRPLDGVVRVIECIEQLTVLVSSPLDGL